MVGFLVLGVTACKNEERQTKSSTKQTTVQTEKDTDQDKAAKTTAEGTAQGKNSKILVAYFTYAENTELPDGVDASSGASIQTWDGETTGNTGVVARMIQETVGADLFSIQTVEKYPADYDDTVDQGKEEQSADSRPKLSAKVDNIDQYDTIFLGFPNWWGDMPMAVYRFLEDYDLSGKTIVPFVTSGGSGFSGSVSEIESIQPDAAVREGLALGASEAAEAQSEIEEWLSGLGYTK